MVCKYILAAGKILLLHDFRLYEDRESVKKMVTIREVMIACP
jgi:hypothetical protein